MLVVVGGNWWGSCLMDAVTTVHMREMDEKVCGVQQDLTIMLFGWLYSSVVKPTICTISQIYFGTTPYMFLYLCLSSGVRLYIQHQVYFIQVASKQAQNLCDIPDAVCTVLGLWWWTERPKHTECCSKINLRYCACLVLLQKYIMIHSPTNIRIGPVVVYIIIGYFMCWY